MIGNEARQEPPQEAPPQTPPADPAAPPADESDRSAIADLVETDFLNAERLNAWLQAGLDWARTELLTINSAIQISVVFGAIIPAVLFGPRLKNFIARHLRQRAPAGILRRLADAAATLATPIAAWIILTGAEAAFVRAGANRGFVSAALSLLTAWIVVRLVTLAIRSPFWSKVAFYIAWPIAALDAFHLLDDVIGWLETISVQLSPPTDDRDAVRLSLLDVARAGIIFAVFMQLAGLVSGLIVNRVDKVEELNPSFKALIAKVLNFALPVVALLFALQIIGFNLASLAIFSGAVGLGIGLGLQKIISNFLAGFTLLADRSIKPGDVVAVGETFGWITDMKARYVSIRTRDGTEHLVPNATFMEEGVVNWSHNDRDVRIHAPVGVAYGTKDLRRVQEICREAAKSTDRVLARPEPVCNLMGFGDSSVDFGLRFWIADPQRGIANVRSEVLMKIWDGFAAEGIEIPFPQRDLHIRSGPAPVPPGIDADMSEKD